MLNIRPAQEKDKDKILKIIKDLDLAYPDQSLNSFWVAEDDRAIVGTANLEEFDGFLFLSSVGVIENKQHQGIAASILERILNKHKKDIYLYTTIPGFFERFGFRITGPKPFLPSKKTFSCRECTPETCVCMLKSANDT